MPIFTIRWLALFLFFLGIWICGSFDEPTFEQIIFHMKYGLQSIDKLEYKVKFTFVKKCFIYPTIISGLISFFDYLLSNHQFIKLLNKLENILIEFLKVSFLTFYKLFNNRLKVSMLLLLLSFLYLLHKISYYEYLYDRFLVKDFLVNNFVNAKNVEIKFNKNKKKNLVLIYLESMEVAYRNKKIHGRDLLFRIGTKELGGVSFESFKQIDGLVWTAASLVASQCGVPFKTPIFKGMGLVKGFKEVMPNLDCLGDFLKKNGYKNIFVNGQKLDFALIGDFLSIHGYDLLYGEKELKDAGAEINFSPGLLGSLHDEDVLLFARKIMDENEKSGKLYNLTILTSDTHWKYGYPSEKCIQKYNGENGLIQATLCMSDYVSDLIKYAKEKGYDKNTDFVIVGDHIFPSDEEIIKKYFSDERLIYNQFISRDFLGPNRQEIIHFDLFPTILTMLGFDIKGKRLGLGYSAFGEIEDYPKNRVEDINRSIMSYSELYLDFWKKD